MEISNEAKLNNLSFIKMPYIEKIPEKINNDFEEKIKKENLDSPESYYNKQIIEQTLSYKPPLKVFEEFINKGGKVTTQDYINLKLKHPAVIEICKEYIRKKSQDINFVNSKPEDVAKIIISLKDGFDRKYGKDKYRIISIGTSPAILSEGLKNTGAEVVFLPITGLSRCKAIGDIPLEIAVNSASKYRNLKTALKYLKNQGVSAEQAFKDQKINILFDYSATGGTLYNLLNLLQSYWGIEIPKEYIAIEGLNNAIMRTFGSKSEQNQEIADIFINDVFFEAMETISNVPHFTASTDAGNSDSEINPKTYIKSMTASRRKADIEKDEERIFREFDEYSTPEARAYSLLVLDSIYGNLI